MAAFPGLRWCVFAAAVALAAGCGKRNAYVPPPPPEVIVATPVIRTVTLYHEFPGTTAASQSVNIIPRVLGYVDSLHFTDGQMVTKGQLLFIIDPRPYQDAYDVALAQVAVADATYKDAKANYARGLEVAKTPGAIAKQQLDTYKAAEEQGKANLQLAQANAANAKLNVDFTHITAPIKGKIGRRLVDVGNLVNANTTLLTSINQYDPMYAYFNVSESEFLAYMKRQRQYEDPKPPSASGADSPANSQSQAEPNTGKSDAGAPNNQGAANSQNESQFKPAEKHVVEMGLSDETGYPHKGTIDFADNTVNPSTGTLLLRGVFSNPEPYVLAPGLFVRIRVPIGTQSNAVLVPDRALSTDQQGQYLLIVRSNDVVEHRPVTTGQLVSADMRIIEKGLNPGERFIVEGLQFGRPNEKVKPVTQSAATSSTGPAAQNPVSMRPPAGQQPEKK